MLSTTFISCVLEDWLPQESWVYQVLVPVERQAVVDPAAVTEVNTYGLRSWKVQASEAVVGKPDTDVLGKRAVAIFRQSFEVQVGGALKFGPLVSVRVNT